MKKINVFNAIDFCNGEIAKEAACNAEQQFMEGNYDKAELKEAFGITDSNFREMIYKDDDGYWRITGRSRTWDSYEGACLDNGIEL